MRYTVIFLLLAFLTISCQDLEKTEKPEDLISEAKMIDVLTEMALLHAARNYNKQKLENTGISPDAYVYDKYDIDSLQFERSNNYYTEQLSQYERIYDSVKLRLQVLKSRMDSLRDLEVKREDSIKKAQKDSLRMLDSLGVDTLKLRDSLKVDSLRNKRRDKKMGADSLVLPPKALKNSSGKRRS